MLRKFSLFIAFILLAGCAGGPFAVNEQEADTDTAIAPPPDDRLNATLWMQASVEFKGASEALYALADYRLAEALADKSWTAAPAEQSPGFETLPPAIILDADETVLDNSAYQAWLIKTGQEYSRPTWTQWALSEEAGAIPGALRFTNAAAQKGVTVFYITNRRADVDAATTRNLAALGFPMKSGVDTVLTRDEKPDWTSKKGTRRAHVAKDYRVLLMFGDNFGDFTDDYNGTPAERAAVYGAHQERWGRDWLVLPNPSYGSWESTPFGNDFSLPAETKRQMKIDTLNDWAPQGE